MAATTRWVQYDVAETGVAGTGGSTNNGRGIRGYSIATAAVSDSFNIGTTNNRLYVNFDGDGVQYITLASGSELDPRFVAKDITERIHNLGTALTGWDQAQCVWEDTLLGGNLKLYSGTLGTSSSVAVTSGTNTAHLELGWGGTPDEQGGTAENSTGSLNGNTGNYITVSGTYNGFFDEVYQIVISKEIAIGSPTKGGSNTYTGTIDTGGVYNWGAPIEYSIGISTTNGTTMGAGTGNVPTMTWTSTGNVDDGGPVELLFSNYWYRLGTKGVMVKFSDAIFNTVTPAVGAWTISCAAVTLANGGANSPVGTAKFVWGSSRGDDVVAPATTNAASWVQLGSRGLYVKWTTVANLQAKDEWFVICTPPQPSSYNVTNLNYGNVTVSTESPVRNVIFEILSGAVEIDTVKFGLQSHGDFDHHGEGNSDTYFRFGTVGPGNNNSTAGYEWWPNVTAADISSDTPPSYLYATQENLAVVADADSSQAIGVSTFAGMVADPLWLNIKLGTSEVGANSTINYRVYFDYS